MSKMPFITLHICSGSVYAGGSEAHIYLVSRSILYDKSYSIRFCLGFSTIPVRINAISADTIFGCSLLLLYPF